MGRFHVAGRYIGYTLLTSLTAGTVFTVYYNANNIKEQILRHGCIRIANMAQVELDAKKIQLVRERSQFSIILEDARAQRSITNSSNLNAFDLIVDRLEVSFSPLSVFSRNLKFNSCSIEGVRGVIDRRHVKILESEPQPSKNTFCFENVAVRDILVTLQSPDGFRPFSISVLNASIPRLRSDWIFFDLMNAKSLVGMYDRCLYSLHEQQTKFGSDSSKWRHFKIDGLRVDHCRIPTAHSGNIFDILEDGLIDLDFYFRVDDDSILMKSEVLLKDMQATLPKPSAILMTPLVSYINDNRPIIKVSSDTFQMPLAMFNNKWNLYDTGLANRLAGAISESFGKQIANEKMKGIKRVGLWNLYKFLSGVLAATT